MTYDNLRTILETYKTTGYAAIAAIGQKAATASTGTI